MFKKLGVRAKVIICIVLIQLTVMTLLVVFSSRSVNRVLTETLCTDMKTIAMDRAEIVELYITDCNNTLDRFGSSDCIKDLLMNPEDKGLINTVQQYVNTYSKDIPNLEGLYVAKKDTYVLAHTNPDSVNKTFREGDSLLSLQRTLVHHIDAYCSGITLAPQSNTYVIPVYKPVFSDNGTLIGFIGAAFYAKDLYNLLNTLNVHQQNTTYALVDVHSAKNIFNLSSDQIGTGVTDPQVLAVLNQIKLDPKPSEYQYETSDSVASCFYISKYDWLFIISHTKDELFAQTAITRHRIITISLLSVVAFSIICWFGVNKLMKPIGKITEAISLLNEKDYDTEFITDRYHERSDEIGTIARAVESLKDALENQNEIYSELLKVQSIGFLSVACDSNEIVLINKEALSMLGVRNAQSLHGNIEGLYSRLTAENAGEIRQMVDNLRNSSEEITCECKIERYDGTPSFALSQGKQVVLSSGKKVLVFSLTDITDKKNVEQNLLILSETDGLTGLYNRRSGEKKISACLNNGTPGLFIMFDANKFKYVNDTFGHSVGDAVLIAIARTMEKTFRTSDILVRLGGDEYVVYATDICLEKVARSVIERFLGNIAKITLDDMPNHNVSVSLGAVLCDEKTTFEDAYAKADELLYKCKNPNENAYLVYEPTE